MITDEILDKHRELGTKYKQLRRLSEEEHFVVNTEENELEIISLCHSYGIPENHEYGCFWKPKSKQIVFAYSSFEEIEKEIKRLTILQN